MAEQDEYKDVKKPAEEKTEKEGRDDETLPESGQEEQGKGENIPKDKKPLGYKKWVLLCVFFLILLFTGAGIRWIPDLLPFKKEVPSFSSFADIKDDHLMEENLSPFFVPPSGSSRGAIRIDLYAVWDGLASIRFQKNKIRTRSSIYHYIMELAEKNPDMHPVTPVLEKEMSRIFQECLGVRGLMIRIKEIKYL